MIPSLRTRNHTSLWVPVVAILSPSLALAFLLLLYIGCKKTEIKKLKNMPSYEVDKAIKTLKKISDEKAAKVNETTPILEPSPSIGYGSWVLTPVISQS